MTAFSNPCAASSTILARITSQYGDVYLRDLASSSDRSSLLKVTTNGLFLGIAGLLSQPSMPNAAEPDQENTSPHLRNAVLSNQARNESQAALTEVSSRTSAMHCAC